MIVGFPWAYFGWESVRPMKNDGELFVRIMKELNPQYRVVQISDDRTSVVKGVDECHRTERAEQGTFGIWWFESLMAFPYDEYLRVDADIVIRADVSEVWDEKFDVAFADERNRRSQNKLGIKAVNGGVCFVRNRDFFKEALRHYLNDTSMDNWQDLQVAQQMTINDGTFNVLRLDPDVYNYYPPPDARLPILDGAKVVHYKGKRKARMQQEYSLLEAA